MSNMSYCRFRNTVKDLDDCYVHINDGNLSDDEKKARQRLIKLCDNIINSAEELEEGE